MVVDVAFVLTRFKLLHNCRSKGLENQQKVYWEQDNRIYKEGWRKHF